MASGGAEELTVARAKRVVKELVEHLEQNLPSWSERKITEPREKLKTPLTVAEVIKAGSLGFGTAVPGDFDLDLVIYSRSLQGWEVIQEGYSYDKWLSHLQAFLQDTLGRKVENISRTRFAVQFKYDGIIDVDLLVSPYWESPADFYAFLKGIKGKHKAEKRFRFSVNASKWQVQFFKKPELSQVKTFIMRAKVWRNETWPKSERLSGRPKSYVLSLLVLAAYEKACAGPRVDKSKTEEIAWKTTQILQVMVKNFTTMKIFKKKYRQVFNLCWEELYRRRDYPQLLPARPRIVDPANPSNNLYETGIAPVRPDGQLVHDYDEGTNDWQHFQSKIGTLDLRKPIEVQYLDDD